MGVSISDYSAVPNAANERESNGIRITFYTYPTPAQRWPNRILIAYPLESHPFTGQRAQDNVHMQHCTMCWSGLSDDIYTVSASNGVMYICEQCNVHLRRMHEYLYDRHPLLGEMSRMDYISDQYDIILAKNKAVFKSETVRRFMLLSCIIDTPSEIRIIILLIWVPVEMRHRLLFFQVDFLMGKN